MVDCNIVGIILWLHRAFIIGSLDVENAPTKNTNPDINFTQ